MRSFQIPLVAILFVALYHLLIGIPLEPEIIRNLSAAVFGFSTFPLE